MAADEPGVKTIVLSGPVTLYESTELRETLIGSLAEGKNLRIELETSGPWDIAGLQLLVSVVSTGLRAGQSVRFLHVPRVCREVADRAGLADWLQWASA